MNYQQTLDFLYSKLPMFTRVGAIAFKKDLHNTIALCNTIGNPQNKFKSIHVGGTNGKGSTSHMLAAVLQTQGYKTGLYTSPHLKDFRERIRINGKKISQKEVIDFIKNNKSEIEAVEPSFFEVTVAMAFNHFAKHQVDFAIIEVGLGGRLDSTNIINPEISVITNISFDHTNMLGNTLAEIATEKAGIIKKNTPVVIGETHDKTKDIFIRKADEMKAPVVFADSALMAQNFSIKRGKLHLSILKDNKIVYNDLASDLTGSYQSKNILTVLETLEILNQTKKIKTDAEAIYKGLKNVKKLTGLMGRWQILLQKPLVICDTGHNEAGITEVIKNINATKFDNLHIVFGMVKDKDVNNVLALLPKNATYYFCKPNLERGHDAIELQEKAKQHQLIGKAYNSVEQAKQAALQNATEKDLIFIGGSTFVVAEVV